MSTTETPPRRAFTLVEAAAAAAALAILAALGAPSLVSHRSAGTLGPVHAEHAGDAPGLQLLRGGVQVPAAVVRVRAATAGVSWNFADQIQSNPNPVNGYVHWSGIFQAEGYVTQPQAFACPESLRTGAPATNPGPNPANWEPGQVNDMGQMAPGSALPMDRQASRLMYTANGALVPRNKFNASTPRTNEFVLSSDVTGPATTIPLTEWLQTASLGWRALTDFQERYKTHRPVAPFVGGSAGVDVYNEPNIGSFPRFFYPPLSAILPPAQIGPGGGISSPLTPLNAVARVGPTGTARFIFLDGHVERTTVQDTITRRLWGERFYSITGNDLVGP